MKSIRSFARTAQVPRQQLTFQARYATPSRLMFSLQGCWVGAQFDDRSRFRLDRYLTLDALASRPLSRGVEVFVLENLCGSLCALWPIEIS